MPFDKAIIRWTEPKTAPYNGESMVSVEKVETMAKKGSSRWPDYSKLFDQYKNVENTLTFKKQHK